MNYRQLSNVITATLGPEAANKLLREISAHCGGERLYIPHTHQRQRASQTDTVASLMKRGVSRRTAYRLIGGK